MGRLFDYSYILATVCFTVYGQLILKWRITQFGSLPSDFVDKLKYLLSIFFDPAIFSGFLAAFLASLAWMCAMTKFNLGHAYPFMALNFAMVVVLSSWLLREPLTVQKLLGVAIIISGTVVAARG